MNDRWLIQIGGDPATYIQVVDVGRGPRMIMVEEISAATVFDGPQSLPLWSAALPSKLAFNIIPAPDEANAEGNEKSPA